MAKRSPPLTEHDVDLLLGRLLQVGVILSAAIVLIGGVIHLLRSGSTLPAYGTFRGEPAELRSIGGIVRGAARLHGPGVIQLGLLVLIATPIARVVFSLYAFARERDLTFVAITFVVLVLLVLSLTGLIV